MPLHLLCVGGEDHALRIPFLTALQNRGMRVSAAGTGAISPFQATAFSTIDISSINSERVSPTAPP